MIAVQRNWVGGWEIRNATPPFQGWHWCPPSLNNTSSPSEVEAQWVNLFRLVDLLSMFVMFVCSAKNGSTAPSPNTITGTILHYDHKIKRIGHVRNLDIGLEFSLQWRFMRGNIFNSKDFPHQSALLSIRAKLPGQQFVHWFGFLIVPNETRWPCKNRSRLSDDVFG